MDVFESEKEWNNFLDICMSWSGTPYKHMERSKGRGVDCTLFLGESLVEAEFLSGIEFEYYPRDWHMHSTTEVVLDYMFKHFSKFLNKDYIFYKIDPLKKRRGDFLTFSTTPMNVSNHVGVLLDDNVFIHCINKRGVIISKLTDFFKLHATWEEGITNVYRLGRV